MTSIVGPPSVHKSTRVRIGSRWLRFFCDRDQRGLERHYLAIWDPTPPKRWKSRQLEAYRRARDAFLEQVDADLGCKSIVLDALDQEGVPVLREAAEVLLAARRAGVTVAANGEIHGDIASAWEPVLRQHAEGIAALLAAGGGR